MKITVVSLLFVLLSPSFSFSSSSPQNLTSCERELKNLEHEFKTDPYHSDPEFLEELAMWKEAIDTRGYTVFPDALISFRGFYPSHGRDNANVLLTCFVDKGSVPSEIFDVNEVGREYECQGHTYYEEGHDSILRFGRACAGILPDGTLSPPAIMSSSKYDTEGCSAFVDRIYEELGHSTKSEDLLDNEIKELLPKASIPPYSKDSERARGTMKVEILKRRFGKNEQRTSYEVNGVSRETFGSRRGPIISAAAKSSKTLYRKIEIFGVDYIFAAQKAIDRSETNTFRFYSDIVETLAVCYRKRDRSQLPLLFKIGGDVLFNDWQSGTSSQR